MAILSTGSIFGTIVINGITKLIFGDTQVFCSFMKFSASMKISIYQSVKANQAVIGSHSSLVFLFGIPGI